MLSVFTPTHNPKWLADTHDSLRRQTCDDFEWVIVPNAPRGETPPTLPASVLADPRVRVVPFQPDSDGPVRIGQLKRHACEHSRGDVVVELDHDDLLTPDALHKIKVAAGKGGQFLYSDAASFVDGTAQPIGYTEQHGWETYNLSVLGRACLATRNFDVTPRSLCEVYYAPDHVRAWTRDFYQQVGGHDISLEVCDDHDLICRSYLAGGRFQHVGGCCYLYRRHSQNTVLARNSQIQRQCRDNRRKYLHDLIDQWLRRTRLRFLDLSRTPVLWDDEQRPRIQAEDDSVGCLKIYDDTLPLTPRGREVDLMNEAWRVLAPGGYLCLRFPSTDGRAAFRHRYQSYWNEESLLAYTDAGEAVPGTKCRFQLIQARTTADSTERRRRRLFRTYADLAAIKGQRWPGLVKI